MLIFGIHVSPEAQWYSRLVIILSTCFFLKVYFVMQFAAEANCFF